jgi:hypothetical protein
MLAFTPTQWVALPALAGQFRDWQTQARHKSVAPQDTFVARNVVPDRGGEGEKGLVGYARPTAIKLSVVFKTRFF